MTLTRAIEDAGIDRDKAERVASVIVDLIHDEVATKADLQAVELELKGDIAATGADLRRAELALKADIAATRTELTAAITGVSADLRRTEIALKADIAALRANDDLIEHRLLTRLGGLMVVVGGVLFAALHYWPPGHSP